MIATAAAVFVGGGLGALSRLGVTLASRRLLPAAVLPYGTLAVNVAGCFVLGALAATFAAQAGGSPAVRAGVTTGFLGGLTTFSTFGQETVGLLSGDHPMMGLVNVLGNVGLGVGAAALGLWVGSRVAG